MHHLIKTLCCDKNSLRLIFKHYFPWANGLSLWYIQPTEMPAAEYFYYSNKFAPDDLILSSDDCIQIKMRRRLKKRILSFSWDWIRAAWDVFRKKAEALVCFNILFSRSKFTSFWAANIRIILWKPSLLIRLFPFSSDARYFQEVAIKIVITHCWVGVDSEHIVGSGTNFNFSEGWWNRFTFNNNPVLFDSQLLL